MTMNQAEILRELRKDKNLTLQELADATGISEPMLRHLEKGRRTGTIEIITKLANFYKVSIDYITCNPERDESLDRLIESLIQAGIVDLSKPLTPEVKKMIIDAVEIKKDKIKNDTI